MHCTPLPGIGIDVILALFVGGNLVVAVRSIGRIDDARIVSAVRQNERNVGVGQCLDFVD